ncbi:MAG: PilZ domain-containing protein [Desulfobacterales bacterium]
MPNGRERIVDDTRITARLIDLVCDMTIAQQIDLLRQLDGGPYKHARAGHRRKRTIRVDYDVGNLLRQDFIRDISKMGVFIETPAAPAVGQKIRLSISLAEDRPPIRLTGRVVRSTEKGFGVAFDPNARR